MAFGSLLSLLAKGSPSPMQSAMAGFQQGATMMPGIREAQLQPQKTQSEILKNLASARASQQGKLTAAQQAYNAFHNSLLQDQKDGLTHASPRTKFLAGAAHKLIQSSQGVSVSTTPGGTNVQVGGVAPAATGTGLIPQQMPQQMPDSATPTSQEEAVPQQANQDGQLGQAEQSLLEPQQLTPAQISDQKQLGEDMKTVGALSDNANRIGLPLFTKLKKAAQDLQGYTGPVIGHLDWLSPQGQRFKTLVGQAAKQIMASVKNIRTQRELFLMLQGIGTTKMKASVIIKALNDALDEQHQDILHQDFLQNYMKQGGNSSSESKNLWSKMSTTKGVDNVPDKYLNFNVSGTNRSYKDYIKTIKNLAKKNPKAVGLSSIPITSLIREDLGGMQ